MSLKAICIIGSPNPNGSTACVVDQIIKGLRTNDIEIQRVVLGELELQFCRGCKHCFGTNRCVQNDDMERLIAGMAEADIVLLASPSYWGDVTGQMKVFFDRSTPFCDTNGGTVIPKEKIGIAVAIRAGTHAEENLHLVQAMEHYFGHLGIKPVKRLTVEGVSDREDFLHQPDKVREAFALGKNILECR